MLPVGNCLLVDLNQNPTAWVNWLLKELNNAQSVGALAAILQAHNREINQLRGIDPVRVIHINNLIKSNMWNLPHATLTTKMDN